MSEMDKRASEPAGAPAMETPAEKPEEAFSRNGAGGADESEEKANLEDAAAVREPSELEQARADRNRAVEEREALLDRLKRTQAEFENIRKRLYKEKEEVVQYAASDTINSLLPIIDDFERAIETEGLDPEIKKGLELIHKRMLDVFSRAGLREVEQHERFDPHLHYAVDRAAVEDEQEDQTILEVYQKGYRFKERLLRASMVKVAVKE